MVRESPRSSPALATVASAALYALSFQRFPALSLAPLAWFALVPFLVVAVRLRPRAAAAWGLLLGFLGATGLAWWFPRMIASYFGVPLAAGWAAFGIVGVGLAAVYPAVFAGWLAWLAESRSAGPLVIAAGWGALELARARLLVGNPWGLFGYSQVGATRLMQIADATGPYGVGLLVMAVNGCLAGLVAPALRGRRPRVSYAAVALALVATLAYGEWRLPQRFGTGAAADVTIVQGALAREIRRGPSGRTLGLARYLELTREARRPGTIVFWPENAVDFYLQDDSPEQERVLGLARDLGADLVLGGPSYERGAHGLHYFNSVFLVHRGRLAGRYDKLHLLPMAEAMLSGATYEAGREPIGLRTTGGLVGTFLCFEAMYPEIVRRLSRGVDLLANLSNDDWFGDPSAARHHLEIASVRAIENRRWVVRAATSGISAVIDPHGRIVAESALGAPAVLTATVYGARTDTPYQRYGDVLPWAAIMLAAAATLCHATRTDSNEGGTA